ncbi:MAG: hypothetical protein KDD25_09580, partial [Bdellovibrionales bacterium]|nr:hypothetical protein [Bdellovibrionales bacterium]
VPTPPGVDSLKSQITEKLVSSGIGKEQIAQVDSAGNALQTSLTIPKEVRQENIVVNLKTLNLRQIVAVGRTLQSVHPFVKLMNVEIVATAKNDHYYDARYNLAGFYPPEVAGGDEGDTRKPTPSRRKPVRTPVRRGNNNR